MAIISFFSLLDTDKCIYGGHVLSPGITFTDYEKCEEYRCYEDGSLSICGYVECQLSIRTCP